jgi:hypothetical protein
LLYPQVGYTVNRRRLILVKAASILHFAAEFASLMWENGWHRHRCATRFLIARFVPAGGGPKPPVFSPQDVLRTSGR